MQSELSEVLVNNRFEEVGAMDVYTDIFRLGEGRIQRRDEPPGSFKTNPIIYMKNDDAEKGRYRIMFEDEFEEILNEAAGYDFAILNGMTYFGRKSTIKNASKCYALIMDIDGQTDDTLQLFLIWSRTELYRIPMPNYIILSGNNIHAYWLFEEPINLYPETKRQLKQLKYAMINRCWNPDTSILKEKQYQGINQGFRPVSCKTKIGNRVVRAFKAPNQPRWTIEEINKYVEEDSRVDPRLRYAKAKRTIEEAKEMWPEWYSRRIENGERGNDWAVSRSLYDWWKRKILSGEAVYHHRYFCLLTLSAIAMRCSHYDPKKNPDPVTYEELRRDAYGMQEFLTGIEPGRPVTSSDIESALEGFDPDMQRMRVETAAKMSAMNVQRNIKRKGRKQEQHLRIARFTRDLNYDEPNGWINKSGRPKHSGEKCRQVYDWRQSNPGCDNKHQCARDTGLSRTTVIKWWDWMPGGDSPA